jgi:hypothetical protein
LPAPAARVNGFDWDIFQRICQRLGLRLPPLVQVNLWRVASKFVFLGEIIFAVTDEEEKGHYFIFLFIS